MAQLFAGAGPQVGAGLPHLSVSLPSGRNNGLAGSRSTAGSVLPQAQRVKSSRWTVAQAKQRPFTNAAAAASVAVSTSASASASHVQSQARGGNLLESWNEEGLGSRMEHLEEQALAALRHVVERKDLFPSAVFPCALIAGDVVILHLLYRLGALQSGRVQVVFIDTFHLFPETYAFLKDCEERFGFKAKVYQAAGFANKAEYQAVHGSDLFIVDIDEYDRICKVEPFGRALKELAADAMINGRRRDHGADRAHLELFEGSLQSSDGTKGLAKVQPLAYWEFRDCFKYLEEHGVPKHPLHDQGFPSIGDVQTTLPVAQSKWFEYGGERSGRFQGLQNRDGSEKTECGIHVGDARAAPASSLTPPSSSLTPPSSSLTPPSSSLTPPSSAFRPPSSSL